MADNMETQFFLLRKNKKTIKLEITKIRVEDGVDMLQNQLLICSSF